MFATLNVWLLCGFVIDPGIKNGKHVEKKGVNCLFDYNLADYRAALLSVMHFSAEYEGKEQLVMFVDVK